MESKDGRVADATGLSQAEPKVSALSGFDPSRVEFELLRRIDRCRRQTGNFVAPIIEGALLEVLESVRAGMVKQEAPAIAALRLALPILEADYESAKEHADSDWMGLSYEALSASRKALGMTCDSDGSPKGEDVAYEKHGFARVGKAVRSGSQTLASEIICDAITAALASLPDDVSEERKG